MGKETMLCMISIMDKPRRKLLILRSLKAHDYWSFCEEMGCGWSGTAIDSVLKAIDKYKIESYGYEYAFETAPKFNFGASKEMGAKMALPVRKL